MPLRRVAVLLLRSVIVDASGVILTTGLTTGPPSDITVAFNRGTGGGVEQSPHLRVADSVVPAACDASKHGGR